MAKLVLMQGGKTVDIPIKKDELIFGRLPECDVKLNSGMISRQHAKLSRDGDGGKARYYIADLGSGNGTFLNGTQIDTQPQELKDGDRVKMGPGLFRFDAEAKPAGVVTGGAAGGGAAGGGAAAGATPSPVDHLAATFADGPKLGEADEATQTVMGGVSLGGAAEEFGSFGVLSTNPEEKLKGVLKITQALSNSFDPDEILPQIVDTLFDIFPQADRGFIFAKMPDGEIVQRTSKLRREDDDDASFRMSRTIRDRVIGQKEAVLSADASQDDRFSGSESLMGLAIRSVMCVPMLDRDGEAIGLINLDTSGQLKPFNEDDLQLMVAVAGQASMQYQSALLLQSFVAKQKQDGEMQIAQGVQVALLPDDLPQPDGYELFASYDSAQAVGGDYYDVFPTQDGRLCLSFGDVAGKGVPGALVMSRMSTVVRNTLEFVTDPLKAVETINAAMCTKAAEGRFVTYTLALLDPSTGEIELVNAGHMPPIIRRADGTIEEPGQEEIGVPIGVLKDYPFEAVKIQMNPGDAWLVYTDGVSEAMAPDDSLFTEQRVREFMKTATGDAATIGRELREQVRTHANGREQNDDVTLMTLVRKG